MTKKTPQFIKTPIDIRKSKIRIAKALHKNMKRETRMSLVKAFKKVLVIIVLITGCSYHPVYAAHNDPILPVPVSVSVKSLAFIKEPAFEPQKTLELMSYPLMAYGTYANDYATGNCTLYVASRVHVPNSLGNANMWDDQAPIKTSIPVVGMVAQTDAGWAGHVAVVEAVNGDGTVTISEMNYDGYNMVDTRVTPVTDWVYLAW